MFNFEKDMSLEDFGPKIPALLNNISRYPKEKQYVYSAFGSRHGYGGHGIIAIAKNLDEQGYKKLTVAEAKKLNKSGKLPTTGVKRYIMAVSTELGDGDGDMGKNLAELLKIYNHKENRHGDLIHVMLASQNYNESIDLKSVRHIHIFESLVTAAAEKQAVGRGRRYCSHADLDRDKGEWNVTVHRYMSEFPPIDFTNIGKMEQDIQDMISELSTLGSKDALKELKSKISKKTTEVKGLESRKKPDPEKLEKCKKDLSEMNKEIAELESRAQVDGKHASDLKEKIRDMKAKLKKAQKRDIKEAKERAKELFTVYQLMRDSAVDCRLMEKFHGSMGSTVTCAF